MSAPDERLPLEIGPQRLAELLGSPAPPRILDVREPWEIEIARFPASIDISLGELVERVGDVPADGALIVVCHHGGRSLQAARFLRTRGIAATSLAGGIDAWARQIDPSVALY